MGLLRSVRRIITGRNTVDGAGVRLVRLIGQNDVNDFDPFLMLDAFDSKNPHDYVRGFPSHPHRGIETITYLISGEIEHRDSLGNHGLILGGDCQWMTAGSGIIHEEMPKETDWLFGVQLWLNLPAKDKMTSPSYGDIKSEDVPVISEQDATVRIISGDYKDTRGAFHGKYVDALFLDVSLKPELEWIFSSERDSTLFLYILQGGGSFDHEGKESAFEKHVVLFGDGDELFVKAGSEGIRFLLLMAKPLNQPVAWGGPIVMNTEEELALAFTELKNNTFIKTERTDE
jgi:redox-sensitive bicupin YhaK (pirin superfamily)